MRLAMILLALSLMACGDRRSFNERYEDTAANLEAKARELDRQANAADKRKAVPPNGR